MEVTFSPDLERFIDDLVSRGAYPTREDVVRAGIARLQDGEEDAATERLRAMIKVGLDDLDAGRSRNADDVFSDLRARHEARFPDEGSEAA